MFEIKWDYKKKFFNKKYYDQIYPSLNFRLSDLHAAIGISQLKKLNKFVNYRNKISNKYKKEITNKNIFYQNIRKNSLSSFHLFIIRIKNINFKKKLLFMKNC